MKIKKNHYTFISKQQKHCSCCRLNFKLNVLLWNPRFSPLSLSLTSPVFVCIFPWIEWRIPTSKLNTTQTKKRKINSVRRYLNNIKHTKYIHAYFISILISSTCISSSKKENPHRVSFHVIIILIIFLCVYSKHIVVFFFLTLLQF